MMRMTGTVRQLTGVITLCVAIAAAFAGKDTTVADVWKTRENLTRRIAAEWHKTVMLQNEVNEVRDVIAVLQDFELYPEEATSFTDEQLAGYDRGLETVLKECRRLSDRIEELRPPVNDALRIIREMVVGEPVPSMFETLEQGNLHRIGVMLAIKHSLDTLWGRTDSVLSSVETHFRITRQVDGANRLIEGEFFTILRSNLGLQSQEYFSRITTIRKALVGKADAARVDAMRRVDMNRIRKYMNEKKTAVAERNIVDALDCYGSGGSYGEELGLMLAELRLRSGEYATSLSVVEKLPGKGRSGVKKRLVKALCFYALGEYDSVLADTAQSIVGDLDTSDLNRYLWVVIECAQKRQRPDIGIRYAGFLDKSASNALYGMHALAGVFVATGDDSSALSVVRQALTMRAENDEDRLALRELSMMAAEILFEQKRYDEALKQFYWQLNSEGLFERALTGIVWCYLKTGEFSKAEVSLRKLINQSPESIAGAEGIFILAKRNIQAARLAWDKYHIVDNERRRIAVMIERVNERSARDVQGTGREKIDKVRRYLNDLLQNVNKEKLRNHEEIAAYFQNAEKLCEFVTEHYYTGTFQEQSFSEGREQLLKIVDSTLAVMKTEENGDRGSAAVKSVVDRNRLKKLVDDASLLSTITLLNRYQWEKEFIEWRKRSVNADTLPVTGVTVAEKKALNAKRIDSLILTEKEIDSYYQPRLKTRITAILSTPLADDDRGYLEYQLAELLYREENERYAGEYDLYEKLVTDAAAGTMGEAGQVAPPVLDHRQSMYHYREVLRTPTDSTFTGAAWYGLGWCFNDAGQFDSAYTCMRYLAGHFPENPYTPQAWMYCGEYNFDKGTLDSALAAFYNVMKYPESEWFDEALYKVAWTQYRLSNPEKAISSFLALVDLGGTMGQALLEKESMDYVAISFSEIDLSGQNGLRRAAAFVKKLGDRRRGCEILHRLAQVYREQGRYDISRKTYNLILSTYPEYEKNPVVEAELIAVDERDNPVAVTLEQKYAYFKKYNRTGAWAATQRDSIRMAADSISAKMLYDAAVSYHQMALQEKRNTLYEEAIRCYRDYITLYRSSPIANECHYNLAEIHFSLGDYRDAVEEFIAVSREYPDSKYRETAAWNAIVAAQAILKRETAQPKKVRQ